MRKRLIFGPVLIAIVILLCWADQRIEGAALAPWLRPLFLGRDTAPPGTLLFLVGIALSWLAARELVRIMRDNGIKAAKRITTTAAVAGLLVSAAIPDAWPAARAAAAVSTAAVAVFVISLLYYTRNRTFEGIVGASGGTMLAFVYLGLMFGFLLAIRREHTVWVLLWVIFSTKNCDTGAYFTGKAVGRRKLIVWLSPGKTWEGLAGGVALASLTGFIGLWLIRELGGANPATIPPLWTGLIAGALFGLTGQAGDLIASLFKRDAGLKDSSHLLPGFGGVLDVIDSPLLVAPVAYWWLAAIHTG
ncbi:MAG: phosphatidate cytidylyltransferase [Phycisphaerales bacterium]